MVNKWIQDRSCFISSSTLSEEESSQYKIFFNYWKSLHHPFIFEVDDFEIFPADLQGHYKIKFKVINSALYSFSPASKMYFELFTFEKLNIIQHLLDINQALKQSYPSSCWKLNYLFIHNSVHTLSCLPPPPEYLFQTEVGQNESIVLLLLELFNVKVNNVEDIFSLLGKEIPWVWGVFIKYYLDQENNENDTKLFFSFIFYKAWLYISAVHIGMKNKLLTFDDYYFLEQFGQNLNLSKKQMQQLDFLTQQEPIRIDTSVWKLLIKEIK